MKLKRNEILILISHYNGLEFDLEDQLDKFEKTSMGLLDEDLFLTQRKRYKTILREYESRINELQTELDNL